MHFWPKIVCTEWPKSKCTFWIGKDKKSPLKFFGGSQNVVAGSLQQSILKYAHVVKKLKNIAITNRLISLKHFLKNINFNLRGKQFLKLHFFVNFCPLWDGTLEQRFDYAYQGWWAKAFLQARCKLQQRTVLQNPQKSTFFE